MSSLVSPPLPANKAGSRRVSSPKHTKVSNHDTPIVTTLVTGMDPMAKIVQPSNAGGELSSSPKLNSSSDHGTKLFASTYAPPQPTHSERHGSSKHTINQPR